MLKFYKNASVMKKLLISPIVMTLMMTVIVVSIFINVTSVSSKIDDVVYDLAPDTDTAAKIMENIYAKRLQVKEYIKTSDDRSRQKFSEYAEQLNSLLSKAKQDIAAPERVMLLNEIISLNKQYDNAFFNIVVKDINKRNQVVSETLDKLGPLTEKTLSTVMINASRGSNLEASYNASQTLKHLLLARLYVFKYLDSNMDSSEQRVLSEIAETETWSKTLLDSLYEEEQLSLTRQVMQNMTQYKEGFEETVLAIKDRNKAITETLDVIGPQIAQNSSLLKNSVFEAMTLEGENAQTQLIKTEVVIIIVFLVSAIVGMFISFRLAKGLVNPINQINASIDQLAKGELTTRINLDSEDELGQLAKNFNRFVTELQQLVTEISSATERLSTAAEETSNITKETSENVFKQQNETSLVATAINEMTATVREVANNTEQASLAAAEGDDHAKSG
ncbi:hypothetical protein LCGC14_2382580, partial [marine sediment metagenome]